ncbi:unnamed protein product [Prorocentrum cordatum]|uniref:Uncharacterized protein n=1 Tax=Prorocentrum cordatum TaxID=2364126 RepID=A0ABN9RZ71_9DINO|nr:unnamed protein product [Polarella glacialis]
MIQQDFAPLRPPDAFGDGRAAKRRKRGPCCVDLPCHVWICVKLDGAYCLRGTVRLDGVSPMSDETMREDVRHMLSVRWGSRGKHATANMVLWSCSEHAPLAHPLPIRQGEDFASFGMAFSLKQQCLDRVSGHLHVPRVALNLPREIADALSGHFPSPTALCTALGVSPFVPAGGPPNVGPDDDVGERGLGEPRAEYLSHSPEVVFTSLKLHSMMKASADLREVVVSACRLVLPPDQVSKVSEDVEKGNVKLPEYDTLRKWWVRFDCVAMLWQREVNARNKFVRCILTDASPISGWNYLCTKSLEFAFPRHANDDDYWAYRLTADIGECYRSRKMPVTVLGHGASSAHIKLDRVAHGIRLECRSEAEYDEWRWSVRHYCSDQGAERIIERCPNIGGDLSKIQEHVDKLAGGIELLFECSDQFLFPLALGQPGHLHILYNSLEHACQNLSGWKAFESTLRDLCAFLGNRQLRRRFAVKCCPPPLKKKWLPWSQAHVDWKWEFLTPVLVQLQWRLPVLLENFDMQKMSVNEAGNSMHSALLNNIANLRPQLGELRVRCESLRLVCEAVDKCAHWLEGCPCHEGVLLGHRYFRVRKKAVRASIQATGSKAVTCPWKGRRGPEMVLGMADTMLRWIQGASSTGLNDLLHKLPPILRSVYLGEFDALKVSITEEIGAKLSHHKRLPWKLMGGYGEALGRADDAKACLAECCAMFDTLWADPASRKTLHRVAVRLLGPGSTYRGMINSYAQSLVGLSDVPALAVELQDLALSVLTERTIESVHATIQAEMKLTHGSLPGFVCAKIRAAETLKLLDQASAWTFLCTAWRKKLSLHDLLPRDAGGGRAKACPHNDVYKSVYGHDLDGQCETCEEKARIVQLWETTLRQAMSSGDAAMAAEAKAVVDWCKDLFVPNTVFTLPSVMLEGCLLDPSPIADVTCRFERPVGGLDALLRHLIERHAPLALHDGAAGAGGHGALVPAELEVNAGSVKTMTIARVTNSHPERRVAADALHARLAKHCVSVLAVPGSACTVSEHSKVIFQVDSARPLSLDLHRLLCKLPVAEVLNAIHIWRAGVGSALEINREADLAIALSDRMLPMISLQDDAVVPTDPGHHAHDDERSESLVQLLYEKGAIVGNEQALGYVSDLSVFGLATVNRLVALNVIAVEVDDFGDSQYRLNMAAVRWKSVWGAMQPKPFVMQQSQRDWRDRSKLGLLCSLYRAGWTQAVAALPPFRAADEKIVAMDAMIKSKWYMIALLSHEHVFSKGVRDIHHDRTMSYYQALVMAPASKLTEIDAARPDKEYRKLLDEDALVAVEEGDGLHGGIAGEAPVIMVQDGAAGGDEPTDDEIVTRVLIRSGRLDIQPASIVFTAVFGDVCFVVRQTWSHTNGKLRFYIACPCAGHRRCFRYTQRDQYASEADCGATLVAWAQRGLAGGPKEVHKGHHPSADAIAAAKLALVAA